MYGINFLELQELGQDKAYVSEFVFTSIFISFVLVSIRFVASFFFSNFSQVKCFKYCTIHMQWTFHPFILKSKKIYTVLIWCRVLACLVVSVI